MDFDFNEFSYLDEKEDEDREESVAEEKEPEKEEVKVVEEKEPENANIYVVKVTTSKEDKAFEMISDKVVKRGIDVYSLARPHGLRGYLLLESPNKENAEEAVFNLPYVKGILPKTITYSEAKKMLEPSVAEIKIEKGDIVEIISDHFKNEKAKVMRIDKAKGEGVVTLLNAAVPIPVTVKLDNLRVIRREDLEEEDGQH